MKHAAVLGVVMALLMAGTAHAGVLDDLRATLSSMQADKPVRVSVHVQQTVTEQDKSSHAGKPKVVKSEATFALYDDHGRFGVTYPAGLIRRMYQAAMQTTGKFSEQKQPSPDSVGPVVTHALLNEAPHLLLLLHGATLTSRHAGKYDGKPVQVLLLNVPFAPPWPALDDIDHVSRQLKLWIGADGVPVAMSESTTVKTTAHIAFLHIHETTKASTSAALRHVGRRLMAVTWRYRKSKSKTTTDTRIDLTLAHGQTVGMSDVSKAKLPGNKAAPADALGRLRATLLQMHPVKPVDGMVHVHRSVSVLGKSVAGPKSATASATLDLHADHDQFQISYPASLLARVHAEALASVTGSGKPEPLAGLLEKFETSDAYSILDAIPKLLIDMRGATLQSQHAATWHGQTVQLLVLSLPMPRSAPKFVKKYVHYQGQMKLWMGTDGLPLAMSESMHFKIDHRFLLMIPIRIDAEHSVGETLRHVGQRLLIEHMHQRTSISHDGAGKAQDMRADLTLSSGHLNSVAVTRS